MKAICSAFFCVCFVIAFGSPARAVPVKLGDSVKLYNGPGGEAPQGSSKKLHGGALYLDLAPFENSGGHDFVTFSLDFKGFDPNTLFNVDGISMGAEAPGVGTTQDDPLDKRTAFLYNQFVTGELGNPLNARDADDLQHAIWYIEDEISQTDWKVYSRKNPNAKNWYDLAEAAAGRSTSFHGVQVLNLNSKNGTGNNQSKVDLNVLYASPLSEPNPAAPVPEPGTLLLLATGFAGIGFYRIRTR